MSDKRTRLPMLTSQAKADPPLPIFHGAEVNRPVDIGFYVQERGRAAMVVHRVKSDEQADALADLNKELYGAANAFLQPDHGAKVEGVERFAAAIATWLRRNKFPFELTLIPLALISETEDLARGRSGRLMQPVKQDVTTWSPGVEFAARHLVNVDGNVLACVTPGVSGTAKPEIKNGDSLKAILDGSVVWRFERKLKRRQSEPTFPWFTRAALVLAAHAHYVSTAEDSWPASAEATIVELEKALPRNVTVDHVWPGSGQEQAATSENECERSSRERRIKRAADRLLDARKTLRAAGAPPFAVAVYKEGLIALAEMNLGETHQEAARAKFEHYVKQAATMFAAILGISTVQS